MPPRKKNTQNGVGRTDFLKNEQAMGRGWVMEELLEKRGYHGRELWLMMAQMAHESNGFSSAVAIENNNYAGIKWYSTYDFVRKYKQGRGVPPGERQKTKDGSGNFYVNFPTKDDFLTTWIEHFLKINKIGYGAPLDAKSIPEEAKRLYYNKYYTEKEPKYTRYVVPWIPVLQKAGLIPTEDDLAYAATSKLYNGKDFMHTPVPAFHVAIPQRTIHAADTTGNDNIDAVLSPAFIASAAKQARRLLPGSNIGNVLDGIAKQAKQQPGISKIVNPGYLTEQNELHIITTDTAVLPVDSTLRAEAYAKLKEAEQEQVDSSSYNSNRRGYNTTPFISTWQVPPAARGESRGNSLPRDFQWLLNGFQYPATLGDTPAVNTHKPAHPAAHAAKGKTKPHAPGTADAITGGGSPDSYRDKTVSIQFRNFTENFTVQTGSTDKGAQETFRVFEEQFLQMIKGVAS